MATTRSIFIFFILIAAKLFSQPAPQWSSSSATNLQYYYLDRPKIKFDKTGNLIVCGNTKTSTNGLNMLLMKYSVAGSLIWSQTYNGANNKDDELVDFELDAQNNIYVTGKTTISTNNADAITIKFDAGGNFIWQNIFSGYCNRNDRGQSISLDNNNNAYITGFTDLDSSNWRRKFFTRKIDLNGATVWTKRHGTDSMAYHDGVKVRFVNNEVRVMGYSTAPNKYIVVNMDANGNNIFVSTAPFLGGMNSSFIDKAGNFYWGSWGEYRTSKMNANGTLAWVDSIPTNLPWNVTGNSVHDIIADTLGNVYTTGRHYGPDYNGPTFTSCDVLTVKYSSSGNIQWSKRYDHLGTASCDVGNSIYLDSLLNVYVGAQSQRTVVASDYDYAVIKYNNNGTQLGTMRYNDSQSADDAICSLIADNSGCIYVTGITMDNASLSNITTQKYCSLITGINENTSGQTVLNAFPNPFSSEAFIDIPGGGLETADLKLYNSQGQLVYEEKYSDSKHIKIKPENLSQGLYYFIIKSANKAYNGKLIKQD